MLLARSFRAANKRASDTHGHPHRLAAAAAATRRTRWPRVPPLLPRMRHHPPPPYMRRSAPWTCTTTAARTSRTPSGCGGGHRGARARGRRRPVGHVPGRAREALTAQRSPARLPPGPAQSCPGRCATLTAPCRTQVSHSVRRRPARPALPALPHARVVPSYPCGQPMPEGCGIGGRLGAPGGG